MVNIKVAVRIRPLSKRELLRGEEVVVRKENKFVLVTNPKISERQDNDSRHRARRFAVDFCYDFRDPESCNQEAVYNEIGSEVLQSMFEGFNACVLAYGHSASGKTYTIMGLRDDPGLTPRLCQGLFDKLNEKCSDERIRVQVIISFLEIYNEKVRDLLGSKEITATSGNFSLRVREHPKLGPYVQGLSQHLVTDKSKLVGLLTTGNRRRSTAATENNNHSSRSHAVFTIQIKQSDGENYETEKSSKVHLVDLAGSERASSSQNKARLKEGANINKSLVTLGNVISVLAESYESETLLNKQCGSKTWQPFVPYRDSILTWLLKDTLGGNSNTFMIATISPASGSLSETVNTLRYAKRTKRIVNQPMVNEDPKVRTIRQLRKEIARLRCLLLSLQSCGSTCELEENHFENKVAISSPKIKWLDSEERIIPVKQINKIKKENLEKVLVKEEATIEKKTNEDEEKRKKAENIISRIPKEYERGVLEQRAAPSGGDACKINDEKKSDVNGSVNDNFSHETQIFSDSLESFSSVFLQTQNSCDVDAGADDDNPGFHRLTEHAYELGGLSAENIRFYLMREFGSCDNLPKKNVSAMLRRSRPDLIKGISTRSKERLLPRSIQSCTDLSNMSQSASENSLISSGSTDKHLSEKIQLQNLKTQNLKSPEAGEQRGAVRKYHKNEILPAPFKKKEKRSEIVNAVTSRLYVTKKKPDQRVAIGKKKDDDDDDDDDDRELEEVKLCRRARMKLFDMSRKLAMTKRIKKTMDSDSQTESTTTTLRLKEKGVTTDASVVTDFEKIGIIEENSKKEEKPCVIMNQVFIPSASNYVVECGKVVRIEAPRMKGRHDTATQTAPQEGSFKNANTSPIKFCIREEDCFSEDSLDSEDKVRICGQLFSTKEKKEKNELNSEGNANFHWLPDCGTCFSGLFDSEASSTKEFKTQNFSQTRKESKDTLLDEMCSAVSKKERLYSCTEMVFPPYLSNSSLEESRKNDNPSSENSFTSADGTDISCSSEASSEDFVFYENPKDKDSTSKTKATSDRELYTITENSEQSDPSDAFSPVQSQVSFFSDQNKDKKDEKRNEILQSYGFGFEKRMKRELKTFDRQKEEWRLSQSEGDNFETKRACKESKTERKSSAFQNGEVNFFTKTFNLLKSKPEKSKNSKCASLKTSNIAFESADRISKNLPDSGEEKDYSEAGAAEKKIFNCSDIRGRSEDIKTGSNRTNFEPYSQKEYLNLNITSSSRALPFSVDAHLFGESSQKDKSTDTMFNSSDSITFVFMGPAKPKTSVLMEIIRRSLGKREICLTQGKSRSRGVQCDAKLMRSVSVDTAMIALTRIARNQEPLSNMQKSSSLGALSSNETLTSLVEQGKVRGHIKTSCQCSLKFERCKKENKKTTLKYSVGTSTSTDELDSNEATKSGAKDVKKRKSSVSCRGKTNHLWELKSNALEKADESEASDFEMSHRDSPDLKAKEPNEENFQRMSPTIRESRVALERRVRFLKPEVGSTELPKESIESLTLFLNEAIQLLKNINFYYAKRPVLLDEEAEKFGVEGKREIKENGKRGFKADDSESFMRNKAESCLEKAASRRSKTGSTSKVDESYLNFTWPRRRPPVGKPPTGIKPKISKSPLPSWSDFPRSNNSLDLTTWCPNNRVAPGGQSWKLSNLSEAQNYSWIEEFHSQSSLASRFHFSKLNFDSLSELESELEVSCRRLETATEQDKMREKILKNRKVDLECHRHEAGVPFRSDDMNKEYKLGIRKEREIVKRRNMEECVGSCICKASRVYPCKYLWPKGCQSSFELDSFGPGSAHCHQLCMFCRKKNEEVYFSALSLNSACDSAGLCRLNYYGFCPCSSFRLSHVTSSPRAYMQHLLALRRQIVSETKRRQFDLRGGDLLVKTQCENTPEDTTGETERNPGPFRNSLKFQL